MCGALPAHPASSIMIKWYILGTSSTLDVITDPWVTVAMDKLYIWASNTGYKCGSSIKLKGPHFSAQEDLAHSIIGCWVPGFVSLAPGRLSRCILRGKNSLLILDAVRSDLFAQHAYDALMWELWLIAVTVKLEQRRYRQQLVIQHWRNGQSIQWSRKSFSKERKQRCTCGQERKILKDCSTSSFEQSWWIKQFELKDDEM